MRLLRPGLVVLAGLGCSCATLTADGARVTVYQASDDDPLTERQPPAGCRLLTTTGPVSMTEREREGQADPYLAERNKAGTAGGNALLVRSRLVHSRRDVECPAASPITDCPGSSGAWYDVRFEYYVCPPGP